MELHEGLGQRKPDARPAGMNALRLEEAVEYVAQVALADTLPRVGHAEGELSAIHLIGHGDLTACGRILEGVGQQVEHHALHPLAVERHHHLFLPRGWLEPELDVAPAGHTGERLRPVAKGLPEIRLRESELQLSVLIFPEVQNLVDQPPYYLHVLVGQPHHHSLLLREVIGPCQLGHGFGNECEGRSQVV